MAKFTKSEWEVINQAEKIIQKENTLEEKITLCEKYIKFHLHLLAEAKTQQEEDSIIFELSAFSVIKDELTEISK